MCNEVIHKKSAGYGWVIVIAGMLATAGAHGFGRMSYGLILPEMKKTLSLTYTQAGLLGTGNFVGYLVASVFAGFFTLKYGSRSVISVSLFLMGLTLFVTGYVHNFGQAFALRLLTGIWNGGAYVPAMALGSLWFDMRRRGLATGIVAAGIGLGTATVGEIVPALVARSGLGWRFAWHALGVADLILAVICFAFLRNRGNPGAGAAQEVPGKMLPKQALNKISCIKKLWPLGIVYFAYGFANVMYVTFFVTYAISEAKLNPDVAGSMLALVGLLGTFCGFIWGSLSDRLGRKKSIAAAYFVLAIGYALVGLLKSEAALYVVSVLLGFSIWSIPTLMAAACGDYAGPKRATAALGVITILFSIGMITGPAVGGYLADLLGGFTLVFVLSGLTALAGCVGALFLKAL